MRAIARLRPQGEAARYCAESIRARAAQDPKAGDNISHALIGGHPAAEGLCTACAETLAVSGAGITLIAGASTQVSMRASDARVRRLAERVHAPGDVVARRLRFDE